MKRGLIKRIDTTTLPTSGYLTMREAQAMIREMTGKNVPQHEIRGWIEQGNAGRKLTAIQTGNDFLVTQQALRMFVMWPGVPY